MKLLIIFATMALSAQTPPAAPAPTVPATPVDHTSAPTLAAKAPVLSDISALRLQVLIYREQVVKISTDNQALKAENDLLRTQLGQKAAESVLGEQSNMAKQVCKDAKIPEAECGQWITSELQKVK